jgi:hypothetical protein
MSPTPDRPARGARAYRNSYRDREKAAQAAAKAGLFTPEAAGEDGLYAPDPAAEARRFPFCLREDRSEENLHASLREDALAYFRQREIAWPDGLPDGSGRVRTKPSNHLCCPQAQCVNLLFPYRRDPEALARLLRHLGLPVARVLPVPCDGDASDGHLGFAWIGARNYLGEHLRGRVARDDLRSRGHLFTSADFLVRFEHEDGAVEVRLGAWKYTEEYRRKGSMAYAWGTASQDDGSTWRVPKTSRVDIYRRSLDASGLAAGRHPDELFFDPFDQMMRLQLLAWEMEQARELGADRVGTVHVAPAANAELMQSITSPGLQGLGETIHAVWSRLAPAGRFLPVASEALVDAATTTAMPAGADEWARWLRARYVR